MTFRHCLYIFFVLFLLPIRPAAQTDVQMQGPFGDQPEIPRQACLSPAQRQAIQRRLEENRTRLREEGLLPEDRNLMVTFDWPVQQATGFDYNAVYGISNFVDLNPAFPNQLEDYNCGTRTYDLSSGYNHQGTDIFLWPFPWHMVNNEQAEVVAAADGVIIGKDDGNPDMNCDFSNPNWNGVYLQHSDGSFSWYGHMKSGSLTTKPVGASVSAGEYLGIVASSGSSSGPHLHFEVYDSGNNLIDPFYLPGGCNSSVTSSWWNAQKPYYDSKINTVLLHSAAPVFNACPTPANTNIADCFEPGDQLFAAAYYHDQLSGQVSTYTIYRPNGTVFSSWTHSSSVAHYAASYWYWSMVLPGTAMTGIWTFEVNFQGETVSRTFDVAPDCAIAVPVELVAFKAEKGSGRQARLSWGTAHETDNWGFEIQRSSDSRNWHNIGWISSTKPNSYEHQEYAFADNDPLNGVNYYRLRQRDFDGHSTYSEVRSLTFQGPDQRITLFPNPTTDILTIQVHSEQTITSEIAIFNGAGQLVYLAMPDQREINLAGLDPGVYFLETQVGNVKVTRRFVRL